MAHGAGMSAAEEIASEIVDPRPYAVGSIQETYRRFPHIGPVLPAIGYSESQKKDLEETIAKTPADVVVIATPVDLKRIIRIDKPAVKVSYDFDLDLNPFVDAFVEQHVR
jgi:predicted GTPase